MKQQFYFHAKDPRRAFIAYKALSAVTAAESDNARSYQVTIAPLVKRRTGKQRKALFGAAYAALMEFSGLEGEQDKRELHRFMCGEFFGTKRDVLGRTVPVRTTTRNEDGEADEIDVATAERFYSFLQRRGAEVGCIVPDPDPFHNEGGSNG